MFFSNLIYPELSAMMSSQKTSLRATFEKGCNQNSILMSGTEKNQTTKKHYELSSEESCVLKLSAASPEPKLYFLCSSEYLTSASVEFGLGEFKELKGLTFLRIEPRNLYNESAWTSLDASSLAPGIESSPLWKPLGLTWVRPPWTSLASPPGGSFLPHLSDCPPAVCIWNKVLMSGELGLLREFSWV